MRSVVVSAERIINHRLSCVNGLGRAMVLARFPICILATIVGMVVTNHSPLDLGEFAAQGRVLTTAGWTTV